MHKKSGRLSLTVRFNDSITIHDAEKVIAEITLHRRPTNGAMQLICLAEPSIGFRRAEAKTPLPAEVKPLVKTSRPVRQLMDRLRRRRA
jgi:hypothetical protein